MRGPKRTIEVLTGQIQPVSFRDMETRVNVIRGRSKMMPSRYVVEQDRGHQRTEFASLNRTEDMRMNRELTADLETDQLSTNFNPNRPEVGQQRPASKSFSRSGRPQKRMSVQLTFQTQKKRPQTSYKRNIRIASKLSLAQHKQSQAQAVVYRQQMQEFKNLYQHLARILGCINGGNLQMVELMIKRYIEYIQSKKLSFIDDFIENRERQLQKVVRQGRLHESLSIAYLFLEMAQSRIENHESYLTNFIGYCLSNVLLVARVYVLKEGRPEFQISEFQRSMGDVQQGSYGCQLSNFKDVLLRIQHNNQIITMMHRKLGRFNPKFQTCIQLFFKTAERKKTSCVQCTYYIFQYLALHIHQSGLTGISKTLQMAPTPYCPPPVKAYTLVLEPLGILLSQGRTRPYLFQFLQWAYKYFDIMLWTWQMPYQPEIQKFYKKVEEYITTKLYRYHCIEEDQIWVKDLTRLGRPLEKVLIVDYDRRIFAKNPKNGVELRWRFGNQPKDKGLLFLCQILQEMVTSESLVQDMVTIYAEELYNIRGY